MNEEIVQQAIAAIRVKLRQSGKGPGQRFPEVALVDVRARFPGGYFDEALKRLIDQQLIGADPSHGGRFLIVTEDGYLWLTR